MSDLSRTPTNHTPLGDVKTLTQWVQRLVGLKQAKVRSRLRGNSLHILIESQPCPDASAVLPPLIQGFAATSPKQFLPHGSAPIDRVVVYGRLDTQTSPAWAEAFYLNQTEPASLAEPKVAPSATAAAPSDRRPTPVDPPPNAALAPPTAMPPALVSTMALARQGQPQAIARYLSHAFSHFGLAVRVRLDEAPPETSSSPSSPTSSPTHSPTPLPRLIVICESIYSPDPLLLAEPIAQRLRALELNGFRDAIVFGQVRGEAQREWALRVDLTPPDVILKEWARWGDVQAITHLLQRMLLPRQIQASALLKDSTLHLTCRRVNDTPPDKLTTIAAIAPVLESLTPQGITAVSIYGLTSHGTGSSELFPLWVHWLNLPATNQPTLAKTTLELAHTGNLAALTFLLDRLLNPNLEEKLTTGGIRVQIRPKADLLHVMVDAPRCPSQTQTGSAIVRFLRPLQIVSIAGVRVYGRRAGQKQPFWSYGIDFSARSRLVPEATPEFAASDAYVSDLLASPGGALVPRGDLPPHAWQSVLGRLLDGTVQSVRRSLIRSELFIASDGSLQTPQPDDTPTEHPAQSSGISVALVWGAIGVLLVVQSDWLLGQWLQQAPAPPGTTAPSASAPTTAAVSPSPTHSLPHSPTPFPSIPLKPSTPTDKAAFNPSGFTQPGTQPVEPAAQTGTLPASPLQPKGAVQAEAYPTFNSRQLDEKLQLYKDYVERHGAPDVLLVGSSRALRGIDPIALETALAEQGYADVKVFNFGINGATAQTVNLIVQQMLPPDKLPKLILWADGARAFNSGRVDMTFNGMLASAGYRTLLAGKPPIPSAAIAQAPSSVAAAQAVAQAAEQKGDRPESPMASYYQAINRALDQRLGALSLVYAQRDRLKNRLRDQLAAWLPKPNLAIALSNAASSTNLTDATSPAASASNSPPSILPEGQDKMDVNGFLPLSNQFNPATYYQKYARVTGDYDSDYDRFTLDGIQTEALTALAQFTQSREIPLVFVNLPLTNDYLDPTRKRYEETFQQRMLALATQLGFTYRDRQQSLGNQTNYFSDPSHLNRYGAYAVSQQLARDVMIPWQKAR